MKHLMLCGLTLAATLSVCGLAKGEVVYVPLDGCDTLIYSVNGGATVDVSLAPYADANEIRLDLQHNGAYEAVMKKSGAVVKTYNWGVSDAEAEVSESDASEVLVDTRAEKTVAGTSAEQIAYSGDGWGEGGSGVTVGCSYEGGATSVLVEFTSEEGIYEWTPTVNGRYRLIHAVEGGETQEVVVVVNGCPGGEANPWEIGTGVTAYVKDRVLYLKGAGEVAAFDGDAPWAAYGETLEGAYLPRKVTVPASVLATLPISVEGGETSAGAITPAGAETIQIVDGKVYLGVSVQTNGELTVATEDWPQAKVEAAKVEDDGTVTLTVPATADRGFMIFRSKDAKAK